MRARIAGAALLAAAALGVAACGGKDEKAATTPPPAATTAAPAPAPAATATTPARPAVASISKDRSKKPEIPQPAGAPPSKLVVRDIVKGKGRKARVDDNVTVQYVGVSYSTGQQFDASWDSGSPAQFALTEGQLIQGWIEGIPGMRVGGRRELVIPPDLGYGPNGNPPAIGPNETLVFVIDLLKIG